MSTLAESDILDLWNDLVDPRTGIVREVQELRIDDDEPSFVHYLSFAASTEAWGMLPNFGNNGGVGALRRDALRKALGEAVERYCSAQFSYDELIWSSFELLDERALNPGSFALYSPAQYVSPGFPWLPFLADTHVSWTRGIDLTDGDPVLLPAAFVFVPYHYLAGRPDTPVTQPISTGLACSPTWQSAVSAALCEVIERDAFTITWQRRLSRPRIRLSTLPSEIGELVARFAAAQVRIHLVDITGDVPCPSIMAIAESDALTSPALAVAAAAHPEARRAAVKALEELAHTRRFASQVMDYMPAVAVDEAGGHPDVVSQREHLRFYCPQESKAYARFLWAGSDEVDLDALTSFATSPSWTTGGLVDAVAATGAQVAACDLTTPDVAELGLSVVRVVVPQFHPLQMGHRNRALGGRRLAEVPDRVPSSSVPSEDNPFPHPFP